MRTNSVLISRIVLPRGDYCVSARETSLLRTYNGVLVVRTPLPGRMMTCRDTKTLLLRERNSVSAVGTSLLHRLAVIHVMELYYMDKRSDLKGSLSKPSHYNSLFCCYITSFTFGLLRSLYIFIINWFMNSVSPS